MEFSSVWEIDPLIEQLKEKTYTTTGLITLEITGIEANMLLGELKQIREVLIPRTNRHDGTVKHSEALPVPNIGNELVNE